MTIPKKPSASPEALEAFIAGGTVAEASPHGAEPAPLATAPTATPAKRRKPIRQKEVVVRQTFVLNQAVVDRIEAYGFWQRLTKKAVLEMALEQFFADKKVRAIPRQQEQE